MRQYPVCAQRKCYWAGIVASREDVTGEGTVAAEDEMTIDGPPRYLKKVW